VPGFFGFANLGRLRYFRHVHDALRRRGLQVHVVRTHPTASLPRRAARLAGSIADTLPRRAVAHLVGHSTGGLDARLFATPGVALPTTVDVDRLAARVGAVVTVATPHHGAPLAAALSSVRGQQFIGLLSLATSYVLRFGHLPLSAALQIGAFLRRPVPAAGHGTLLDDLSGQLLADFSIGRRRAVQRLLGEVISDQSLLPQLTPEAMQVFNAVVRDRPGARYGAVVTRAQPPGVRSTLAAGLDPGAQALHGIYQAIYRLSAATGPGGEAPLTRRQRRSLHEAYGRVPRSHANDGIVPTRSQVWGAVIAAVDADHLDVIGHFNAPRTRPPHYDWLTTGSGFTVEHFADVWDRVGTYLVHE
jgi:hypothetical protein